MGELESVAQQRWKMKELELRSGQVALLPLLSLPLQVLLLLLLGTNQSRAQFEPIPAGDLKLSDGENKSNISQ